MAVTDLSFKLTHNEWSGIPVVEILENISLQGLIIPVTFRTDWASIPLPLRWVIPIFGRSCQGALYHDYACWLGINKKERSINFLDQMLIDNTPKWQAYLQYWGVLYWPGKEKVTGESDHLVPAGMSAGKITSHPCWKEKLKEKINE